MLYSQICLYSNYFDSTYNVIKESQNCNETSRNVNIQGVGDWVALIKTKGFYTVYLKAIKFHDI